MCTFVSWTTARAGWFEFDDSRVLTTLCSSRRTSSSFVLFLVLLDLVPLKQQ